ncbi:MAG TPA: DUF1015 domain-containing protein, partial [Bacteroidota bacterium]|nr:DUF1015 domain-containing protein [Bacteroidota bacterium]
SLWRVQEEETIAAVSAFMRDKRIFIADGHHRYETALRYRDACRARNLAHRGQEPYNFVPMYLTNLHDSGLVILPTHRILHDVAGFNPGQFILELKKHFLVETVRPPDELLRRLAAEVGNAFGLFVGGQEDGYLLRLRDPERLDELPELIRRLDVSVLHTAVLKGTLGLTEEQQEKKINLNYERDPWRAIRAVKEEGAQAAFIMNPTRIDQVRAVAESGMVMPQKSTYFYPKLLSGLVAYSFGNE